MNSPIYGGVKINLGQQGPSRGDGSEAGEDDEDPQDPYYGKQLPELGYSSEDWQESSEMSQKGDGKMGPSQWEIEDRLKRKFILDGICCDSMSQGYVCPCIEFQC